MCLVNQITNSQFESNGRLRISIMTSSLKMTSKKRGRGRRHFSCFICI